MRRALLAILITLAVGCFRSTFAGTITIGTGANTTDANGLNGPQDPDLLGTAADISIFVQGSGSISNKALLALLIPNDTTDIFGATNPLGAITTYNNYNAGSNSNAPSGTGSSAFAGTGFLGLGAGSATYQGNGFWGDLTSGKLNAFLDSSISNSNQMSNFVPFDAGVGVTAADFGVYTFAITTGALPGTGNSNGLADIRITGAVPKGSIVVALSDNLNSTVWTNDGGANQGHPGSAPEPGTPLLLAVMFLSGAIASVVERMYGRSVS